MADLNSSLPVQITTSIVPGTGATHLGKAEDGASADGDTGVGMLAVRKVSPANTSGTDGDYEFLQMSAGRLWVSATVDAALPVGTNSIGKISDITTSIVPGTGATNLGKAEDAVAADGDTGVGMLAIQKASPANTAADGDYAFLQMNAGSLWVGGALDNTDWVQGSSRTFPSGFVYDDISPVVAVEGKFSVPRISSRRELYVQLRDAAGNERGLNIDASGRITVVTTFGSSTDAAGVNTTGTKAALAAATATTTEIQYTVAGSGPATKFAIKGISASASGKIKVRVLGGTTAGILTADKAVFFNSTANPNVNITFPQQIEVPTTGTGIVRLEITNLEATAMDVYGTIYGAEV